MANNYFDELKIKNVENIRFALSYFYLLNKGLKKDLNRDALVFFKDLSKVSKHKLPYIEILVVLNKKEG